MLAGETGGRYHRSHGDFNADLFTHKVLREGFTDEVSDAGYSWSVQSVMVFRRRQLCHRLASGGRDEPSVTDDNWTSVSPFGWWWERGLFCHKVYLCLWWERRLTTGMSTNLADTKRRMWSNNKHWARNRENLGPNPGHGGPPLCEWSRIYPSSYCSNKPQA